MDIRLRWGTGVLSQGEYKTRRYNSLKKRRRTLPASPPKADGGAPPILHNLLQEWRTQGVERAIFGSKTIVTHFELAPSYRE